MFNIDDFNNIKEKEQEQGTLGIIDEVVLEEDKILIVVISYFKKVIIIKMVVDILGNKDIKIIEIRDVKNGK